MHFISLMNYSSRELKLKYNDTYKKTGAEFSPSALSHLLTSCGQRRLIRLLFCRFCCSPAQLRFWNFYNFYFSDSNPLQVRSPDLQGQFLPRSRGWYHKLCLSTYNYTGIVCLCLYCQKEGKKGRKRKKKNKQDKKKTGQKKKLKKETKKENGNKENIFFFELDNCSYTVNPIEQIRSREMQW